MSGVRTLVGTPDPEPTPSLLAVLRVPASTAANTLRGPLVRVATTLTTASVSWGPR